MRQPAPHRHSSPDRVPIEGFVAPEFWAVRQAFERNFADRGERGAACAIYHRGAKVVDLWGGYRSDQEGLPWDRDTLVLVFSVSKGMAAVAMAVAHSQGLFELDETVANYWPEFAAQGKQSITVRQLLSHQAGLIAIDVRLDTNMIADHDRMAELLARQTPAWPPGTRHGYHTLTLGWYQNELLRRVDPKRRSLGEFFRDEVARPLGVEFYIGLPDGISADRLAVVPGFGRLAVLRNINKLPRSMVLAALHPQSLFARSVRCLGFRNPATISNPEFRRVEIPSANGIGTARALARIYDALATGGHELGITEDTRRELTSPAELPSAGSHDAVLKIGTCYRLGFSRPSCDMPFGVSPRAFGCPGAGGSFAMGDPDSQLSFAYVTNTMGFQLFDDPREKAVRDACYGCLAALPGQARVA